MEPESKSLGKWVDQRQKTGLYTFTLSDARHQLELRPGTLTKALHRLSQAGRISCVRKGFYVIVPLEYQAVGTSGGMVH